jgi:pimeloyl-ACP methyl ester carboxylesterase
MNTVRDATLIFVDVEGRADRLAGAWYPPPGDGPRTAFLHLHGKGGNFYQGPGLFLPQLDEDREYAHLSLNMRCHDLGYTRYDKVMPDVGEGPVAVDGGMWERMADGAEDIQAGVAWLNDRGYSNVVLAGHSSGAYYAVQVLSSDDCPPSVSGGIILSTVISYKRNLHTWFPDDGLDGAIEQATDLVRRGLGHALLPIDAWYYAISAASLLERVAEPDGIFEEMLKTIDVPVMFVCGEQERRVAQWRAVYDSMPTSDRNEWLVLPGVSHDYTGAETQLSQEISRFVARSCR